MGSKTPSRLSRDPPQQQWISTRYTSIPPHPHTKIDFLGLSLRFLKPALGKCVYRWAVKQLKVLDENAHDLVSSQSKHWEINLKKPPTIKVAFPQSCCLDFVCTCVLVCVCASLNLVKSDFTSLNLDEH